MKLHSTFIDHLYTVLFRNRSGHNTDEDPLLSGKILLGLAALGLAGLWYGNKRIKEWEIHSTEDAPDGDYISLADGTRIHFLASGQGEPVILIHGWRDSAHTWRKNLPELAKHFRVYALDLPGFGFSTRYSEPVYTIHQFAHWLAQFMQAMNIPRANIVGNSLGGATALEFCYEHPDMVTKLVLEDAWAYPFLEQSAWLIGLLPRFVPRGFLGALMTNRWTYEVLGHLSLGDPSKFDPESVKFAVINSRVRGSIEALVAMIELPIAHSVWRRFDRCQSETLVIWGERDLTFPVLHGHKLTRELSNARLAVLPKAGHLPHSEFPEQVNAMLIDFLLDSKGIVVHKEEIIELVGSV